MNATRADQQTQADADALLMFIADAEAYADTQAQQVARPEYIRLH